MTWVNKYVKEYYDWLKEKTFIQEDSNNDWAVINTPFIGAFNDGIDIYAKIFGDKVRLSDNGETFNNLELLGVNIQGSKNRRSILDSILLNYGLKEENDELVIDSKLENFSQSKHNFLAGILEINDLYYLSKANVNSIFKEDVRNYLDEKQIIFTPDFISKGETGLEFTFDLNGKVPMFIAPIFLNGDIISFIEVTKLSYESSKSYTFEIFKILITEVNESMEKISK